MKTYYRIYSTLTNKYIRSEETGGFLVFEYNMQAWNWIAKRLKGSNVYKVVAWRKK